jgi:hypothetical protein
MAENDSFSGLSAKQARAIACLLTEPTVGQAALAAGVSERTVFRWLDDQTFSDAWNRARFESLSFAIGALQVVAHKAVRTLVQVMETEETPPGVKVHAARSLLEFSLRAQEQWDLEQRLAALEEVASCSEKEAADVAKKGRKRVSAWPQNIQ